MEKQNSFNRVLELYISSILLYFVQMIIWVFVFAEVWFKNNSASPKATILVLIGGLYFMVFIIIVNLIQFIVVPCKKLHSEAYLFPILIMLLGLIYDIIMNDSHTNIIAVYCGSYILATIFIYARYLRRI